MNHMIETIGLFTTPITYFKSNWSSSDHAELKKIILEMENSDKNKENFQYSMSGKHGYHTKNNLFHLDIPILTKFKKTILDQVKTHTLNIVNKELPNEKELKYEAWGMIYREHSYSVTHQHPLSDISGVYYIEVPEKLEEGDGELVLLDPRPTGRFGNFSGTPLEFSVKPITGTGVLFPGWLEHYVKPHLVKDKLRIAIAFNIYIKREIRN